ncbi:MAG: EAL domain-containing protein [Pseudomonadota bacterium]
MQLLGFFAIRSAIYANARDAINNELVLAERVFNRLLEQNAQKLTQSARLLAADTGFKSAIADNDNETIESALDNQRLRVQASLAMLIDTDRKVKAATIKKINNELTHLVLQLIDQAEQGGSPVGTTIVANLPSQVVVVPVKAPIIMGWVVMVFPIDKKLATEMFELSSLQVSILTRGQENTWQTVASTIDMDHAGSVLKQLPGLAIASSIGLDLDVAGSLYRARLLQIGQDSGQTANVILMRSFSEAIAPYDKLQWTLVVLTFLGFGLALAGSIFTAKRIAQPLEQLAETAKSLGAGNYQVNVDIERDDEIGELAKTFDTMREDISKRELEIRLLAYWDALTNLPNRAQFFSLLENALVQAKLNDEGCYVLMLDLNRFKYVNDVMGHAFGDALLCEVGRRIQLVVENNSDAKKTKATVARLGGDEFAVLLPSASLKRAKELADKILHILETPLSIEDQTVDLGAGLGIAGFPEHASDADSLLRLVEVAMYTAKLRNDGAVVYHPSIDQSSKQNLSLLSELRGAIDRNEFRLYVQPKLLLATGKVVGIESLVRWVHPEKGMVFPDNFIPFAEQTGFIRVLTRWMMEQSAHLCRELSNKGIFLKISVNLSTRDLLDQDLTTKIAQILEHYQVKSSSFCLEITESSIMDDPLRAQQTLHGLHVMGFDLSIDDFGTGYSSLAYLKRLPVDELKIDKSFVLNMEKDIDDTKIVRSTIDLGHNMGLRVVAEGIENEAVWHLLSALGCDQGQGYFMSKPMPATQLEAWLAQWQAPVLKELIPSSMQ